MALDFATRAEVRPGEMAFVKWQDPTGVVNATTVCNRLRTGEYMCRLRDLIMYGTLRDIHDGGYIDSLYLAIIASRYRGRIQFDFVARCVSFPDSPLPTQTYVPTTITSDH